MQKSGPGHRLAPTPGSSKAQASSTRKARVSSIVSADAVPFGRLRTSSERSRRMNAYERRFTPLPRACPRPDRETQDDLNHEAHEGETVNLERAGRAQYRRMPDHYYVPVDRAGRNSGGRCLRPPESIQALSGPAPRLPRPRPPRPCASPFPRDRRCQAVGWRSQDARKGTQFSFTAPRFLPIIPEETLGVSRSHEDAMMRKTIRRADT